MIDKLVVTHGISSLKLRHALRMGGLIAPSLAICHVDHPCLEFGEIALVADLSRVDPARDRAAHLFSADIYSSRYPEIYLKFKARDFAVIREAMKPFSDRYGFDELSQDEIERKGVEGLADNDSVRAAFLASRGIELTPQVIRIPELPAWLVPYRDDQRMSHELREDEAFVEACVASYYATVPEEFRERKLDHQSRFNLVNAARSQLAAYQRGKQYAGRLDSAANHSIVRLAIMKLDDSAGLRDFADRLLNRVPYQERIFSHSDSGGARRYIEHTAPNVLKVMKRELQGGEKFNYGIASLRALYAPRIRNLSELDKYQGLLQSSEQFKATKAAADQQFFALREQLTPYHDRGNELGFGDVVIGLLEDLRTMPFPKAAANSSFARDIPEEIQQQIHEFCTQLSAIGTEYFECKLLRLVELDEFHGAAIPDSLPDDLREALQQAGLKFVVYPARNEAAKADAIRQLHGMLEPVQVIARGRSRGSSLSM